MGFNFAGFGWKKKFPSFTKRDSMSSVLCNVSTPKSNKGIISSWSDIVRRPL